MKRTRIKPFRSKPRRGQPTREDIQRVRLKVYERSGGCCELSLREDCIHGVLPFEGSTPWDHGHLVHKKSVGSGGATDEQNCVWGCWRCHLIGLHNEGGHGKICPKK